MENQTNIVHHFWCCLVCERMFKLPIRSAIVMWSVWLFRGLFMCAAYTVWNAVLLMCLLFHFQVCQSVLGSMVYSFWRNRSQWFHLCAVLYSFLLVVLFSRPWRADIKSEKKQYFSFFLGMSFDIVEGCFYGCHFYWIIWCMFTKSSRKLAWTSI